MDRIKSILESYRKAKNQVIPTNYESAQEWVEQIKEKQSVIEPFLQNNDYSGFESTLKNFLKNEKLSRGIFNIPNMAIIEEYKKWRKKNPSENEKIVTPAVGNPATVLIGDFCLDEKGGMTLYFNYNITWGTLRFHYHAKKTVELFHGETKPLAVEIGGGFGGFAYHLLKKQKNMTYVNFDFPELIVLASYYLTELYPHKKILLYADYDQSIDINDYDIVLLPNFELPSLKDESVDVFLNFRSMSEMNMNALAEYMNQIARALKYNGYFFHENEGVELLVTRGNVLYKRILSYDFPIPQNFEEISVIKSLFYDNRYFECLYKKTAKSSPFPVFGGEQFSEITKQGWFELRNEEVDMNG